MKRLLALLLFLPLMARAEAEMPMSKADLKDLFVLIDSTLFERRGDKIYCWSASAANIGRAVAQSQSSPESWQRSPTPPGQILSVR